MVKGKDRSRKENKLRKKDKDKNVKKKEKPVNNKVFENSPGIKKGKEKKSPNSKKSEKSVDKKGDKELVRALNEKDEIIEEMRDELEETKQLLKNKEDRLLRMIAEFDNFRKRIGREQDLRRKRMYADVLENILPVLDDFDRAFEIEKNHGDDFTKGIKLIHNRLNGILEKLGIKEIDAEGNRFNPEYHEAMGEVESEGVESGNVAHVVLKGYTFDGMVIRPAKVIVAKKKENNC
ncbi:MAG: nucleotide exchange factor GrpE [Candidatus Krumholzibacteriota bacterium]|nr:nucleotide exchange factor GrpE [Candidatus Krumholzibacteriota bacterium]